MVCRSRATSRWRSSAVRNWPAGRVGVHLGEQPDERVGVGGVARLGALGLGHAELVEQHPLELLGRAEVDLLADRGVRRLRRELHATGELGLQRLEVVDVDRDAGLLHQREQVDQRQLDLGEQAAAAPLLDLVVERVGEVDDRPRVQHRGVGGVGGHGVVEGVEGQLPVVGRALLELALEVAQRQVGQVVGPLVGSGEVGRQGGVADQPPQRPPARRQRQHRALRVVQHLGARGVGEPRHQRRVVLGRDLAGVDPGAGAVGRREGQGPDLAGARAPPSLDGHARAALARVRGQPVGHLALAEADAGELEARLVDRLALDVPRLQQSLAQHPELQGVEQGVHELAVPRLRLEVGGSQLEVEVADELVELPVADHVAEVLAQRLTLLARDLVGVGDDVVEAVVLLEPPGREPGTDARHAGQVVGRLPHDRRELGVAPRRDAVPRLDRLRGHPRELGDAAHRVEHRRPLGDQLEGVAVAGEDQHVEVVGEGLGDQGGDDVVGLVAVLAQVLDLEGVEDLVDERQLAGELVGGLVALGLVLGVLLEAERLPRLVEGDADVGRLLVAQHVDEHRGEPEDRVGVLTRRGREVLDREGEEGTVGQRVAVEQEQTFVLVGHRPTLVTTTDSGTAAGRVSSKVDS